MTGRLVLLLVAGTLYLFGRIRVSLALMSMKMDAPQDHWAEYGRHYGSVGLLYLDIAALILGSMLIIDTIRLRRAQTKSPNE